MFKPAIAPVPLAIGRTWRGGAGKRYEQKLDGVFKTRKIVCPVSRVENLIAGELLAQGEFYGFHILARDGQDLRGMPTGENIARLDELTANLARAGTPLLRPAHGNGGEFLEHILAAGGEGVIEKDLAAPWSVNWFKCKRVETFYCVVTGFVPGSQSVEVARLADYSTLNPQPSTSPLPCGRVPLLGGKCDKVRVGSVLKLNAFGLTAAGKLREPRIDADAPGSWLVRF